MKSWAIIQLLTEQDLDILSLQEVNPLLARKIERNLQQINKNYKITTSYEKTSNPVKNLRVEYNMIISRLYSYDNQCSSILTSIPKKITLKKLLSIRKRYLVSQQFEDKLYVNNTHLDYSDDKLSGIQLEEVFNALAIQSDLEYEPILTGNLNHQPSEPQMVDFLEGLSDIGMQVVENKHKTYVGHTEEQPVDYIIIPDTWKVESIETLQDYDNISSHRPVIVKAKRQ